jgi:hypothetical protein
MFFSFKSVALSLCVATGFSSAAQAQVVHPEEQVAFYADTRGWDVYAINHSYNGFIGCRAVKNERGEQLALEYYSNMWQIVVPTQQTSTFGGAIMGVDKADFDAQFGFVSGYATKELTPAELQYLKRGSQLGVEINGDYPRYWSLSGSTAAILKIQECTSNGGQVRQAQATQAPAASQPQTVTATCDTVFTGPYSCQVTRMAPEPGYVDAFQVDPQSGNGSSYFLKMQSESYSEVWEASGGSPWRYLGVWAQPAHSPDCAEPVAKQTPEARNNLGQDAWNFCLR